MHHLLLILILIITSFRIHLSLANTSLRIKKCCPENQQLYLDESDDLKCGNVEDKQKIQDNRELYTNKQLGAGKCEYDKRQNNKTNATFDGICAKESNQKIKNETSDVNNNSNIWWIPNDLKFIRTNNDSTSTIIKNVNLNRDSFIFNESIPCFNQEPEFLLIEDNVFIDLEKSELVLSKLDKVPEYKIDDNKNDKKPNQVSSNINTTKGILNDTPQHGENAFENEENWKITTKSNEVRKRGFANDLNIVKEDSDKVKIQHGGSLKTITSRFHSDDFCIDRIVFTTEAVDNDEVLDDDISGNVNGVPHANDTSSISPFHLDEENTNNVINTEDINNVDDNYIILLCPCQGKSSNNDVVCVRKCCPEKHLLHVSGDQDRNAHCALSTNSDSQSDLGQTQVINHDAEAVSLRSTPHYIVHAPPRCSHGSYLLRNTHSNISSPAHSHSYKIMVNSSVLLTSSHYLVPQNEYCIDSIYYANSGHTRDGNILLCRPARVGGETSSLRRLVYTTCFIVGTTFLVLTLAVYAMLSELRKSVHSWNIISHIACSIVAYVGIVVANLYDIQYSELCILLAYVIQTSFLSSQLWLNVMCIDIAFTFSGLRAPRGSHFSSMDHRKFFYYSCYTWGTTAFIAGLTALFDQTSILDNTDHLKPNFGVNSCWFKESAALAVFFYGPIGFLLLANLVLFHYTCWKIRTAQKETAITTAHRHVGGRTEEQTRSCVTTSCLSRIATFLKLFLLMGITWSFELLSWSLGGPRYIWYLTDLLNVLRGVFIFIILCCKRHVISLLKKRIQHGHRTLTRRPMGHRPRAGSTLSRRYSKSSITTDQMILSRLNLHSNAAHSRILEEEEGKKESPPLPPMILGSVEEEGKG